jgi:hypothetical protein
MKCGRLGPADQLHRLAGCWMRSCCTHPADESRQESSAGASRQGPLGHQAPMNCCQKAGIDVLL